jgi:hypothetical protein
MGQFARALKKLIHSGTLDTFIPTFAISLKRTVLRPYARVPNMEIGLNSVEINCTSTTVEMLLNILAKQSPSNTVLFEKLINSQLVKKFPAFYGTRKFITVFTTSRQSHPYHLTLLPQNVIPISA